MQLPAIIMPSLPGLNMNFFLGTQFLFVVLGVFFIIYLLISLVLFYHWTAYGMGSRGIVFSEIVFLAFSVLLFITAFLSATYY